MKASGILSMLSYQTFGELIDMKKLIFTIIIISLSLSFAQQQISLSGVVKTPKEMPANSFVSIHTIDKDNVWLDEIATSAVVAGTFGISSNPLEASQLTAFVNGSSALLPGLQNEYTIEPAGVNFARAVVNVYVDNNGNSHFDNVEIDAPYIGIASLDNPVGFYSLIYVDQDARIIGKGQTLDLKSGWNIFTIRFPTDEEASYNITNEVNDILLDVFLP